MKLRLAGGQSPPTKAQHDPAADRGRRSALGRQGACTRVSERKGDAGEGCAAPAGHARSDRIGNVTVRGPGAGHQRPLGRRL
jgi:hypothetical protein